MRESRDVSGAAVVGERHPIVSCTGLVVRFGATTALDAADRVVHLDDGTLTP